MRKPADAREDFEQETRALHKGKHHETVHCLDGLVRTCNGSAFCPGSSSAGTTCRGGRKFTATQWTQKEIADAKTPDRLPPSDKTVLELDIFQAPLGGNSCGPVPLEQYITRAGRGTTFRLDYTIIIQ